MTIKSSKPSKKWIGKILEIKEDGVFGIISGSNAYSGNLFKGQRLEVIGVQEGNWLRCKLLSSALFKEEHGIQMSEMQQDWHPITDKTYSGSGIIWGISLNFDRKKFKIIK
jgi:hypothetical protein